MKNIAIVVVAYNRPHSLTRLLDSLKNALYYDHNVPLVISIDKSGDKNVASIAKSFEWPYGQKKIIEHPERLGLRKHVLYCGNLTREYGAVVVLEDDIFVSKYFFNYVTQTVEKYNDIDNIAGISLYNHISNVGVSRPFNPQHNGYDAYFLQYAQSWGQVWTYRMWSQFYEWYKKNEKGWAEKVDLPGNVMKWPDSSWLKYYISFIVDTNRYFVYPYVSLTTNFTDVGTHNKISKTSYHVPLLSHEKLNYNLPSYTKDSLRYDVFFENENLGRFLNLPDDEVCVDLYGNKKINKCQRYLLTTKSLNYRIIKEYALQLKPHELNVLYGIEGNGIFLYDTFYGGNGLNRKKDEMINKISEVRYDIGAISNKRLFLLLKNELLSELKRRLRM